MANEGGETPRPVSPNPDARQAAREYVASLGGREPTFEESQALKFMGELGIKPIAGASDTEPPERFPRASRAGEADRISEATARLERAAQAGQTREQARPEDIFSSRKSHEEIGRLFIEAGRPGRVLTQRERQRIAQFEERFREHPENLKPEILSAINEFFPEGGEVYWNQVGGKEIGRATVSRVLREAMVVGLSRRAAQRHNFESRIEEIYNMPSAEWNQAIDRLGTLIKEIQSVQRTSQRARAIGAAGGPPRRRPPRAERAAEAPRVEEIPEGLDQAGRTIYTLNPDEFSDQFKGLVATARVEVAPGETTRIKDVEEMLHNAKNISIKGGDPQEYQRIRNVLRQALEQAKARRDTERAAAGGEAGGPPGGEPTAEGAPGGEPGEEPGPAPLETPAGPEAGGEETREEEAGFNKDQRRARGGAATLLDKTIDDKRSAINPDHFIDPQLKRVAQTLHNGDASFITYERLADFGEVVMSRSEFADPNEIVELRHIVRDLLTTVGIKEGKETRELPEEAEARFYRGQLHDIQSRINELRAISTRTAEQERELDDKTAQLEGEKDVQRERLIHLVERLPLQQGPLTLSTIDLIADYDESLYALVNRLIAHPLNLETGRYYLGFFGENNFESVSSYLEERSKSGRSEDLERYRKVIVTKQAVEIFHQMNSLIVTGHLEDFVRAAEQIQPEHLDLLQGIFGSGTVMRLFDQEYAMLLARDGWINNENYGKMMGFEIESYKDEDTGKSRGRVITQFEGSVFKKFERLVMEAREREARVPGAGGELARLHNWEIKWAYNIGKILHNLSLRPAEWISQGRVPQGDEKYASFPQENMARLMNWFSKMGYRFEMGRQRGGDDFIDIMKDDYAKNRDEHGYSKVRIKKIGGTDLSEHELPSLFWVQGSFSSWRQSLIVLRQVKIDHAILPGVTIDHVSGEESELTVRNSLGELLDTQRIRINKKSWGEAPVADKVKYLISVFLEPDPDKPGKYRLREDVNHSLGVIVKNGTLSPEEIPSQSIIGRLNPEDKQAIEGTIAFNKVKEQIRQAIWERAAEDNPLAIIRYLHGLELIDDKGETAKKVKIFGTGGKAEELHVDWETLYEKLTRIQEMRVQSIRDRGPMAGYSALNTILDNLSRAGDTKIGLTEDERKLVTYIQDEGRLAAKEFANVDFNFNPFMDSIFEDYKYGKAGAEYYRRRNAGDLGSLHAAQQAGIKMITNPGGLEPKEAQEVIHQVVENIASPHGYSLGQERGLYWASAWGRFNGRGSNASNAFTEVLRQWGPVNGVLQFFQRPNSLAQKWLGAEAKALSKKEIFDWGSYLRVKGTLGTAQIKKFRKRFGGLWLRWLSIFADIAPLLGITAGFQTVKEGFNTPELKTS